MKELQLKVGMNYEDIFLIYGLDRDIAYYVTYQCTGAPPLTQFSLEPNLCDFSLLDVSLVEFS